MVHTLCSTTGIVVVLSLLLSIVRHAYGEGLRGVGVSEASEFIRYRISQTKLIAIPLDNLTSDQSNAAAVKPLLRPTPPDAWEVFRRDSKEKMIILRLKPGRSWLPDHYGFQETKRWPLRWYGLERNGVATEFEAPVTIGYIIEDMANVVCDDSCKTSFDGTCTDPLLLSSLDAVEGDRPSGPCAQGTDCTDCGGVEQAGIVVECDNACTSARDGVCDDNRGTGRCRAGTDCADCGPYRTSHYTGYASPPSVSAEEIPQPSSSSGGDSALWVLVALVVTVLGAALYHTLCRGAAPAESLSES